MKGYEENKGIVTRLEFEPESKTFAPRNIAGTQGAKSVSLKRSKSQQQPKQLDAIDAQCDPMSSKLIV